MLLLPPGYYQIKKTKKKGRGVFVRQEIPAGTIIGDYLGLLMEDAKAEILEKRYGNACYSMDYNNNGLSIFPVDIKAAGVHLINHSCAPNCDAYFYYGHTLYFALRRIWSGEELTIDYGFDPDDSDKKEFLYPCFCDSPFCRGTMYTSVARLKHYGSFYRQETKGQKFKLLPVGQVLGALEKYPAAVKDNSIFDLFVNLKAAPLNYYDRKIPSVKELRKRLRASGRRLNFKKLGLKVLAVINGRIVVRS
ncbi:MAG: SET domain-containing protein-lysine N-methyltransferase [Candidatus Falkowbacteria bacterium]|nr:SET domain-containing protein-lysine N-methyltransferase [Candidatus Falkowbacteria bacterium]